MTPEEKKDELLEEFSKEKAIDIVETLEEYAVQFKFNEWIHYWKKVKSLIKESKS